MGAESEIKVGCCGFVVSQKEYFTLFNLIEIQNTFYQIPRLQTAERWRGTAPRDFEFTMKAWQLITHEPSSPTYRRLKGKIEPMKSDRYGRFRATPEVMDAWRCTAMFARTLGVSIVVFQCPASFRPQYGEFQYFRLHDITGYDYRYTDVDLQGLRKWVDKRPTYLLFNNNWMKDDALRFIDLVQREKRGHRT